MESLNNQKNPFFDSIFLRPLKMILRILDCPDLLKLIPVEKSERFEISSAEGKFFTNFYDTIAFMLAENESPQFKRNLESLSLDKERNICDNFELFYLTMIREEKKRKIDSLKHILIQFENDIPKNINSLSIIHPFHLLPYACLTTLESFLFSIDFLDNYPNLKSLKNWIELNEELQPKIFELDLKYENDFSSENETNYKIFKITSDNLDKFIDYAILNSADYYYISPENKSFYVDHIPFSAFPMKVFPFFKIQVCFFNLF
jgi:hypothetical protein